MEEINYSKHSENFVAGHKKIEVLISEFGKTRKTAHNGSLPYRIYQFVTNCAKELTIMKFESSLNDKLYNDSSTKVIQLSTIFLFDWIELNAAQNPTLLNARIQDLASLPGGIPSSEYDLKIGKTLLDICKAGFNEINKIEMDDNTKVWFSNIYTSLNLLKDKSQPKSGCYIATMAYGDFSHPQVIYLRHFRDTYLLNNYFGKLFINIYYRISPKFVALFGKSNFIVWTSRKFLDVLIKYILPKGLYK